MRKSRLYLLLALSCAAACRCGPEPTRETFPDLTTNPNAIALGASCPLLDEQGQVIAEMRTADGGYLSLLDGGFLLENKGVVGAPVAFKVDGPDKDAFIVENVPTELGPSGSGDVTVFYAPRHKGAHTATVTFDDDIEDTEPVSVALSGDTYQIDGVAPPSRGKMAISVETFPNRNEYEPCQMKTEPNDTPVACRAEYTQFDGGQFPTFYGSAKTLRLKLRNNGCAPLIVTGLELSLPPSRPAGSDLAFRLVSPSSPPSAQNPLAISAYNGNQEVELAIEFRPTDLPIELGDPSRGALLTITTNDPLQPTFTISLFGEAAVPAFTARPLSCNFSSAADNCGASAKVADRAYIKMENFGTVPVQVDAPIFTSNRFFADAGFPFVIGVSQVRTLEVGHIPEALAVSATLTLNSHVQGGTEETGSATINLFGGVEPCISTDPAQLVFEDVTSTTATETVNILNCASGGTLVLNRVTVENPNGGNFFELASNVVPGTQVAPGGSTPVSIKYNRPPAGGSQEGILRIEANQSDYPGPEFYKVTIFSSAPADLKPVAVFKLPDGGVTSNGTYRYKLVGNPKTLDIDGTPSFDPQLADGGQNLPVTAYRFVLQSAPGLDAGLTNNGVFTDAGIVQLSVHPASPATYRVNLQVRDNQGQQSSNAVLNVITE